MGAFTISDTSLAEEAFIAEFARVVSQLTEWLNNRDGHERLTFRNCAVINFPTPFASVL